MGSFPSIGINRGVAATSLFAAMQLNEVASRVESPSRPSTIK